MPQSLAHILIHLVFSTKDRARLIDDAIRPELHAYLATIFKDNDSPALLINSVEDHVHVLFVLSRTHTLSKVVEEIKKGTSKWIKTKGVKYGTFAWQNGYGAFSVSESNADSVLKYIAGQKEHHRVKTFEEEFRSFLEKHRMKYDEKYVWD